MQDEHNALLASGCMSPSIGQFGGQDLIVDDQTLVLYPGQDRIGSCSNFLLQF